MAQSVEHVIGNDEVISSILISSSIRSSGHFDRRIFVYCTNLIENRYSYRRICRKSKNLSKAVFVIQKCGIIIRMLISMDRRTL